MGWIITSKSSAFNIFAQSMGFIRHLQILIGRDVCRGSKVSFCPSVPAGAIERRNQSNRSFYLISLPKLRWRGSFTTSLRRYDPKAQWISLWKIYTVSLKFFVLLFYELTIWLIDTCCRATYTVQQTTWNPVLCRSSSRANSDVILRGIEVAFFVV